MKISTKINTTVQLIVNAVNELKGDIEQLKGTDTQNEMSVSQFLEYINVLTPINGKIVVRNVNLVSGSFTESNNCLTNLPSSCNKIVFENFDTGVALQYMFCKTDNTETNLEVIMDLKEINITNGSSGTYNLKVSFPELVSVQGYYCMDAMFYNYSNGTYNLEANFPKLISIKGNGNIVSYMFINNASGIYILNLSMPELQEISETTTNTILYLCNQMFLASGGTYTINKLYLPKLTTFKQAVSSSGYFGKLMFTNQSNQWIVLNNNVFGIDSSGQILLKYYYNTSTQATFNTDLYVKKQIVLEDCSLLYFTNSTNVYKLTNQDYQKLSYYNDLQGQIELNKYQYYFTSQQEMTVNYFLSYFSNLISIDGVIYVKNIKLTSGSFTSSSNCLTNLPTNTTKIIFQNFNTTVALQNMFYKNDTATTNLEVIMDIKQINVQYALTSMFNNYSTGTYNLKVSFLELTSVQGRFCMQYMFYNYTTGTYNLVADFPKLTSISGTYELVTSMFYNYGSGTYTLNLSMPELTTISETTTSTSYTLCQYMFQNTSGGTCIINRLYLPKLTTFKQAVSSGGYFGQSMFSNQYNQWIVLNNNVFQINFSGQILLKYYYNTSTQTMFNTERYIKKQINLGDCSLLYFTSNSDSYTLTEADYQKLTYYKDILNGKLIKQSLDVQQLVNRIQGNDTNDYNIQIYGVDTIGYDAYRLTLSSGDEFILACSSENVYTCSGSNVSYSFNSSSNSLMINDTSVSLTKNGTTYTGTNDSITYTIIPYEETTTNIQQAISKLNIALGTILTEMRSQNLTLFGDQISNNVSNWSSMLDYLNSKIGNVSNQTINGNTNTTLYGMILALWSLISGQSTGSLTRYANASTTQRTNLLSYVDGVAYTLGITPTSSTTSDNGIAMTVGSYSTNYTNVKSILNAMNRLIYTGSSGTLGTNYQYRYTTNTFSSSYTKSSTTYYNYKDIIQSLNTSVGYIGTCLNSTLTVNKFDGYLLSTSSYTKINDRVSYINTAVGNVIGYLTGQQVEISVSDFLTYFSGLKVQNGVVYVKNIKLTSGSFSSSNNCLTNLPTNTTKVVFENFDTSVALQYMFYKNDTTETNLEVVMDLKEININYAFNWMFYSYSTGIYNLKVSFPELISVQGSYCMCGMFQNYLAGTYNLIADFPKLTTISGDYNIISSTFRNNSSGTYTLNLSMPKLQKISETTTSTSYKLCQYMFYNYSSSGGIYIIIRLYLPKLATFKQAVSSSGYFGYNMFVNQSNQWICLNNSVFQINSSQKLLLNYLYNTSTSATFETSQYVNKQINLGTYSLLYISSTSSYTLTEADYQKLSYYPEVIGYLTNKLENFTITWEELIEKSNSQNTFNNLIIKSQSHTSDQSLSSSYTSYIFNKCIFDTPLNNMFPSSVVQVAFNQCTFYQITNFNNMFLGNVVSVVFGERCRFTHGTSMSIFNNSKYLNTLSINKENLDSSLLTQDSKPKIIGNGYSYTFIKPLLQNASLSNGSKYTLSFYPEITYSQMREIYTSASSSSLTISRKYLLDGSGSSTSNALINSNITEIIFDHIAIANENYNYMFYNNAKIQKIKFQDCWTPQRNLYQTFYMCQNLTEIDLGTNNWYCFIDLHYTFAYCRSLVSLDLSKLTNQNASHDLQLAFYGCSALTSITFPSVNWNVSNFHGTFYGCSSLTTLDLSNWVTNSCSQTYNDTFYQCQSLTQVKLHENFVYGTPTVDNNLLTKNTNGTQLQERCSNSIYWYIKSYSKSGSIYTINLYPYNSQKFTISLANNSNTTYIIISQSITDTILNSPGLSENTCYKWSYEYYYYTSSTNKLTLANSYTFYVQPENTTQQTLYTTGSITDTVLYRTSEDMFITTSQMSSSNNELVGNGNTGSFYYNESTNRYVANRIYWGYQDATDDVCYYACKDTNTGVTNNSGYYICWDNVWFRQDAFASGFGTEHILVLLGASLNNNQNIQRTVYYYNSSQKSLVQMMCFRLIYNDMKYWITTFINDIEGPVMFQSNRLQTNVIYYYLPGQMYMYTGSTIYKLKQQTLYSNSHGSVGDSGDTSHNIAYTYYTSYNDLTGKVVQTNQTMPTNYLYSDVSDSCGWTGVGNTYLYDGTNVIQIYWKCSLDRHLGQNGDCGYCFTTDNSQSTTFQYWFWGWNCLNCFLMDINSFTNNLYYNCNDNNNRVRFVISGSNYSLADAYTLDEAKQIYYKQRPDVKKANVDALLHAIKNGLHEGTFGVFHLVNYTSDQYSQIMGITAQGQGSDQYGVAYTTYPLWNALVANN